METNIELDTRILNKNLEITKLTSRIDSLTSDLVHAQARQVFKPYMISVLREAHELIVNVAKEVEGMTDDSKNNLNGLLKDLRKVIRFMTHKKNES
tara:strand:+ start:98 stop:385 length:288 start_codon:yes stop_codon:yes gene_type:complete